MKNQDEFIKDWIESHGTVSKVCAWLRRIGVEAFLRPPSLRPTEAERWEFSDDGDIAIVEDCQIKRVEVKTRNLEFSTRETYPYPTVFIDETYHVDRLDHIPLLAYVIVSRDRMHCCVIPAHTKDQWGKVTVHDASQGRDCTNYAADPDLCDWRRLDEAPHRGS
jgi:hypothetical protein